MVHSYGITHFSILHSRYCVFGCKNRIHCNGKSASGSTVVWFAYPQDMSTGVLSWKPMI